MLFISQFSIAYREHYTMHYTQILGVTITNGLSMAEHIHGVISSCSQTLHALRVLRANGMPASALHEVFRAVVIASDILVLKLISVLVFIYSLVRIFILLWTHAQRASMLYFADVFLYFFLCPP